MRTITKESEIKASADKVWEHLKDLGDVQNFSPTVSKAYYITDQKEGEGAARVCELQPFGTVEEVVTDWRDGEYVELDVIPVKGKFPVKNIKAKISIGELNEKSTLAKISLSYKKKGLMGYVMGPMIKAQYIKAVDGLIKGLKIHTETGRIIDGFDDIKGYVTDGIAA